MKIIAFCTTCKGRAQHIEHTLPENLRNNAQAKFVLVNYNSPDHLDDYVRQNHAEEIESDRLTVFRFTEPGPFRMAHAKNLAHRAAIHEGAEILVNLDADNLTGRDFDKYVGERLDVSVPTSEDDPTRDVPRSPRTFLWAKMVKGEMRRGISGRIAVTREAFFTTGGYDEIFKTWSPDDKDFNVRLRRLGYEGQPIDPQYLDAVNHNDKMRFREYPEAASAEVVEAFELVGRDEITVANQGHVGCGVLFRNFSRRPIELSPIPTRVFGIGWHKTATVSLHAAFLTLGLSSAHWPSAHWAKTVWGEMTSQGRSLELEKYYAACDLPIPLLYEELYRAYPGSKFVLTVRDEEDWLASIEAHWRHETNPFRHQWDTDPFTHKVHQRMYGRKDFDRETMRHRYRKHNADVLAFFKDKPRDLLVMDMSKGAGWHELCGFLRFPIPDVPYPKRNSRAK